jgi:hypothetical protein
METVTKTVVFLGRCAGCKVRARFACEVAGKRATRTDRFGTVLEYEYTYALPGGRRTTGRRDKFYLECLCGRWAKFARLLGRIGPQKCGAKCQAATGPNCECQCAGKNHGTNHEFGDDDQAGF